MTTKLREILFDTIADLHENTQCEQSCNCNRIDSLKLIATNIEKWELK